MKPIITIICCILTAELAGCGGGAAAQSGAKATAAALTGEEKIAADKNPQCQLFRPDELAKFAGMPLQPGRAAISGCQWLARAGEGSVMIQVAAARYHEPHRGAQGFRTLTDVGTKGFAEQSMGGWNAGAIDGAQTVVVAVSGNAVTDATAIALLKETIARRSK